MYSVSSTRGGCPEPCGVARAWHAFIAMLPTVCSCAQEHVVDSQASGEQSALLRDDRLSVNNTQARPTRCKLPWCTRPGHGQPHSTQTRLFLHDCQRIGPRGWQGGVGAEGGGDGQHRREGERQDGFGAANGNVRRGLRDEGKGEEGERWRQGGGWSHTLCILCTPLEGNPVLPGNALSSLLNSVSHLGLCQPGNRPLQHPGYVPAGRQHQPVHTTYLHTGCNCNLLVVGAVTPPHPTPASITPTLTSLPRVHYTIHIWFITALYPRGA